MKLLDAAVRQLFEHYTLPLPAAHRITAPSAAYSAAQALQGTVLLRAQVPDAFNSRYQVRCDSPAAAQHTAEQLLGSQINRHTVQALWVEAIPQAQPLLDLSIALDRPSQRPMLRAKQLHRPTPREVNLPMDPLLGFQAYHQVQVASEMLMPRALWDAFFALLSNSFRLFTEQDALEVNLAPLARLSQAGEAPPLVVLSASVVVDDNALFRHADLLRDETPEQHQRRRLRFVPLEGQIGCLVNGAGLALATPGLAHPTGPNPGHSPG
ncbi:MAG: hypothetical protein HC915_10620 [Anaerolineae bacterium]|nr:hypothetical protein [Anaerolineae bacterium]